MSNLHILIAGLGNPAPHLHTRHSVGNLLIDFLAARLGTRLSADRGGQSAQAELSVHDAPTKISLFKPNSYMNLSGPPITRHLKSLRLPPSRLLVLHDSLGHKPCAVHPKAGGSANGHNGLRSLASALGTDAFARLRLGIGAHEGDAAAYVLGRLSEEERRYWEGEGVERVWRAVEGVVKGMRKEEAGQ